MIQSASVVRIPADNPSPDSPETLIDKDELARRLGVSPRSVWRQKSAGDLPAEIRLRGAVRWRSREIDLWIKAGCPSRAIWERTIKETVDGGRQ